MSSAKRKPSTSPKKPSALRTAAISGVYLSPLADRRASKNVEGAGRSEMARKKGRKVVDACEKQGNKAGRNGDVPRSGNVVVVDAAAPRRTNQYSISPERTLAVLRKANVITKTGRLTKFFK
jgi:hypothetical protein